MTKKNTGPDLKAENAALHKRVALLQDTIGLIRQEVGKITVPRDYAEDLMMRITVIDRIINRT
tara:strand:- start:18 stop:206 length:189 start_codon:yes stop_codon:yes gene_type:complete